MKKISFLLCMIVAVFATQASTTANWTLSATEADSTSYSPPVIGNGQFGAVMHKSGLTAERIFDASAVERGRDTHISSIIPSIIPINLSITSNSIAAPISDWRQTLYMSTGQVTTSYALPSLKVECTFTALRSLPNVLLAQVEIQATKDADVMITNSPVIPSSLDNPRISDRHFKAAKKQRRINRAEGTFNGGKDAVVSSIALQGPGWTSVGTDTLTISLKKGQRASMSAVASTTTTMVFSDPWNESERQVLYAITTGNDELLRRHTLAWDNLWKGDIIIEGDPELQAHTRAAIYNIYTAMMPGSRRSIAPMGLSSKHYYGHIFWDADTWILPALAILQPELARSMADYRIDGLPQARRRAASYGFQGAMYPWESDDLGEESTPTFALTGPLEHHITGDVARGAWLSFCATADTTWLANEAYPLLRDCADYWVSRVSHNDDGTYSITGVVGAYEYAIGVDDNAFTNGAAIRSLQYATQAAQTLGIAPDPQWEKVASGIKLHKIAGSDIIAEYKGYNGQKIKQADVALLAFPLDIITDPAEIDRNISYYDAKIDSLHGPAMSHSAMAVNYARMGDPERASRYIARSYRPNLRGPFHNLSETPGNNHVYFATGAGGLLQALIFGYAGLDIDPSGREGIVQRKGTLPSSIKKITVKTPHRTYTVQQ